MNTILGAVIAMSLMAGRAAAAGPALGGNNPPGAGTPAVGSNKTAGASPVPAAAALLAPATMSASDLYHAQGVRDPFLPPGSAAPKTSAEEPVEFSIHNLTLKGILRDPTGDLAILIEAGSGASYILKGGRLYNSRRKRVPGVTGIVKPRRKTVHLMTPEKDVQTLILGEDKDKEGL